MSIRRLLALAAIAVVALGGALIGPAVSNPAPAGAYAYYGSMALSPATGAVGRSWDYPDQASAERAAISYCGYNDCQVVVSVRNGCAALAASSTYYGYGAAPNLYSAQQAALYYAGSGSQLYSWFCTSGHSS